MPIELQPRDLEIMRHIARFGMTVPEVLSTMPYFHGVSPDGIKRVLLRLSNARLIASESLYGYSRKYWYLTRAGGKLTGYARNRGKPLKEDQKIRAFAKLYFCCMNDPPRWAYTTEEFKAAFPLLWRQGMRNDFYLAPRPNDKLPILGYLRIDKGGEGRWTRVVRSLHRFITSCTNNPEVVALIRPQENPDESNFEITLVTSLHTKARQLVEAFRGERFGLPVHLHVVPDLFQLVVPTKHPLGREHDVD